MHKWRKKSFLFRAKDGAIKWTLVISTSVSKIQRQWLVGTKQWLRTNLSWPLWLSGKDHKKKGFCCRNLCLCSAMKSFQRGLSGHFPSHVAYWEANITHLLSLLLHVRPWRHDLHLWIRSWFPQVAIFCCGSIWFHWNCKWFLCCWDEDELHHLTLKRVNSVKAPNTCQSCVLATQEEEQMYSLESLTVDHRAETSHEFIDEEKDNIEGQFYHRGRVTRWISGWLNSTMLVRWSNEMIKIKFPNF